MLIWLIRWHLVFRIGVYATLAIAVMLFVTTAASVKSDMTYPEFRRFFAKGETWLELFVLVSAL